MPSERSVIDAHLVLTDELIAVGEVDLGEHGHFFLNASWAPMRLLRQHSRMNFSRAMLVNVPGEFPTLDDGTKEPRFGSLVLQVRNSTTANLTLGLELLKMLQRRK